MSWTQGIQIREDTAVEQVNKLDTIGKKYFGNNFSYVALVWDITIPDKIWIDFEDDCGNIRSLKANLKEK